MTVGPCYWLKVLLSLQSSYIAKLKEEEGVGPLKGYSQGGPLLNEIDALGSCRENMASNELVDPTRL